MKDEINKIIQSISDFYKLDNALKYYLDRHKAQILLDYITNLQEENERLKELCDKYEEEHSTAFNLWTMKMKEMPDYEEKINNLKSKIDKVIELKHNWQSIKENATIVFDNNSLIEFMNNLEKILKEDK